MFRVPISIILVTYCSACTIGDCLTSVSRELAPDDKVFVVDNASADDTVEIIESLGNSSPNPTLLRPSDNLGYSRACNIGIRESKSEVVILLNPDTLVSPGAFQTMVQALQAPEVGSVGPLGDNAPGDQFVLKHYPEMDMQTTREVPPTDEVIETKLLSGFCMAFRRETLDKVGLLDEDLFLGADDLEMSWRLRTMGYKLVVAKGAYVRHISQASFASLPPGKKEEYVHASDAAFVRKLQRYYGSTILPTSEQLFGCDIFDEALARNGAALPR
ncbi:MAG: glycosyltransferase family 2 protein [Armatimonadetes bacterium]|nr:glycosyltransferase family 2 protein [Armatimonadota bacterium]